MKRIAAFIVIGVVVILSFTKIGFLSQGKILGGSFLSRLGSVFTVSSSDVLKQLDELKQENASLKAQIFDEKLSKSGTVEVYSNYPLNSKKDIAIAAGSLDGVREGAIVTWGEMVLVGKVTSVSDHTSIVSTIFDPSWEMSVRIGQNQANALFRGGNTPKVTLVPRENDIKGGDLVVTASKDFPYGLEVGKIKDISDMAGMPFREASLETEIQLSDLRYVTILN